MYLILHRIFHIVYSMVEKYDKNTIIHSFRKELENIPNWNQDIVLKESNLILEKINCDYFSDIITAVYLSHTKILTTINKNIKGDDQGCK